MEVSGIMLYRHIANLVGIKEEQENKFYFRCIDLAKPTPNKNTESFPYTIIGTKSIAISDIGPNETVKDSTENVKVTLTATTLGGYKDGEATCYYKQTGQPDSSYVQFFSDITPQVQHSQDLWLTQGNYNYTYRCVDFGGNADVRKTGFNVYVDHDPPLATRLYYEEPYLKMNTNEKAECVYDITDCSYYSKDGIAMNAIDDTTFFTDWKTDTTLYIKCKDIYTNEPQPDRCTVIARPYDLISSITEGQQQVQE